MVILGSTGSIGANTLLLAKKYNLNIEALSCSRNYKLLNAQIRAFKPKFVCIQDKNLKDKVNHDKVFYGDDGILQMINECKSELAVNSLVGFGGLMPSITIQQSGKTLALANKESLVVGGKFLDKENIRPIDSEHFGIKFLLQNQTPIKSIILTASGGAFYKTPTKNLSKMTPKDALKHPNWNMGAKITIDSATMANKLFEIIEAYWLFGTKNVDAVVEQTSVIHAFVNFCDGSTTAHISKTDMKLAIAHALFDGLNDDILPPVNLHKLSKIHFKKISLKKYPIFSLKNSLLNNPDLGVIVNAANEVMVKKFLENRCKFTDIAHCTLKVVDKFENLSPNSVDELIKIDAEVKKFTSKQKL